MRSLKKIRNDAANGEARKTHFGMNHKINRRDKIHIDIYMYTSRLRPDGSPVEEDKNRPLPRDDDLETYRLANSGNIPRPNRHRKIATISALKQQHFAAIALQRELQPPHPQQVRRQFRQTQSQPQPLVSSGYYYSKGQA